MPWLVLPKLTRKTLGTCFHKGESRIGRREGGALTTMKIGGGDSSVHQVERGGSRWSPAVVLCASELTGERGSGV